MHVSISIQMQQITNACMTFSALDGKRYSFVIINVHIYVDIRLCTQRTIYILVYLARPSYGQDTVV